MYHSSHFMKTEDRSVMPQMPSSSSTGKHRGMKRDTMRASPGRHSTCPPDPDSRNRTQARRRIQLAHFDQSSVYGVEGEKSDAVGKLLMVRHASTARTLPTLTIASS
ncbi:hypothetical protein TSTA_006420 [Talaromyces stipitatus ATCC 10500]|uniref:Uncharacterized protein n=1 Tax=Talaromyces stipitatus (strain ATCC 10500 / CBS 375.48 / QM 6759 / NRRL 1006) TaxID=441959 RepID=B8MTY6_TALSN|nr:uncharacterized protein TSTA_006420 [Talaromyces stipitatus ATCC 10500]EED12619.1 hypothetical protein TSTA_006420 [Talaromyces stipitatus ATCC 10500]